MGENKFNNGQQLVKKGTAVMSHAFRRKYARLTAALCILAGFSLPAISDPLSLEQVIKEVCTKSDSVKSMKQTIAKSQQMVREKWANALPTVSASISAARAYGLGVGMQSGSGGVHVPDSLLRAPVTYGAMSGMFSSLTNPDDASLYGASISIQQPIYTFGKVGSAVQVANDFLKATQSNYGRNMQQLQLLALDAYYGVFLTELNLDIARRSLARKIELNEFLSRNFKLGSGSKAQVLATLADVQNQKAQIITVAELASASKMMLNSLMGRSLSDSVELDTNSSMKMSLLSIKLPEASSAVESAQKTRGDLKSIGFLTQANTGGAQIFNAMYLPTIGAQGSFGTNGNKAKDMVDWDKRNWSVGIGLKWMIFDGFANNAIASQYRADAEKLSIASQAIAKAIEIEIQTDLAECASADSNIAGSRITFDASKESYDLTNENFKQGSGQFVDLQLAEERLRQAEMGAVNARYRQMRSRAALLVAMGQDIVKLEGTK
jgi:HAE1 family hydrophobic/amphiphilic exporter-1